MDEPLTCPDCLGDGWQRYEVLGSDPEAPAVIEELCERCAGSGEIDPHSTIC